MFSGEPEPVFLGWVPVEPPPFPLCYDLFLWSETGLALDLVKLTTGLSWEGKGYDFVLFDVLDLLGVPLSGESYDSVWVLVVVGHLAGVLFLTIGSHENYFGLNESIFQSF
jgi:hypothetical protein